MARGYPRATTGCFPGLSERAHSWQDLMRAKTPVLTWTPTLDCLARPMDGYGSGARPQAFHESEADNFGSASHKFSSGLVADKTQAFEE